MILPKKAGEIVKESTDAWFGFARENLSVASKMIAIDEPNWAAYMCHLAVEKTLKGLIAEQLTEGLPPRIHDLDTLADKVGVSGELLDRHRLLISKLAPLNTGVRYDDTDTEVDIDEARQILEETEEFYRWLTSRLSK
jgi:HEPN domain-containing protein